MNDIVKILPNYKKFSSYIQDVKNGTTPIMLSGLTDAGKVHFAYATLFYSEKPICIVTYNELQAKKIIKDLEYFEKKIDFFPKREIVTYDYIAESKDNLYTRINTLNNIYNKKAKIVVTTIEAIMQKIVSKDVLYKNILKFKVGETINLDDIKEKLIILGYERTEMADAKCSFSIRGGIIDIAISEKQGVRIELWGDEIDSIRYFDTMSQRSTEKIEKIEIYPAHEFILEKNLDEITNNIIQKYGENEDIEQIKEGNYLSKIDRYFDSFYQKQENLLNYLSDDYIIFLDEINKIKTRCENVLKDTENLIKSIVEKNKKVPDSLKNLGNYLEFLETIKTKQTIYLEKQDIGFVDKQSMHAKRNGYSFSYREVNFFRSSMDLLFQEVQEAAGNKTVAILCGNKENVKKVQKLLIENVPVVAKLINDNIINKNSIMISEGELSNGFECYDFNLLVITVSEIFSAPQKKRRLPSEFKQGETVIFSELKPGDYIVHKTNGIGEFVGVSTIKTGDVTKDYIKLKYKDDDILYIPTNSLDNIRKYIGTGDRAPKINRLRK
ncbi:MAG: CarD family transcriptional regulator [Clostridia bacterium]